MIKKRDPSRGKFRLVIKHWDNFSGSTSLIMSVDALRCAMQFEWLYQVGSAKQPRLAICTPSIHVQIIITITVTLRSKIHLATSDHTIQ